MQILVAHLYAQFLNIYGDRGNILALKQRAKWRGIDVILESPAVGAQLDPDYYDLYFIGGGQDRQQQIIAEDLYKHAANLRRAVESGVVILSICGGYQLLGHYYRPSGGSELRGLSLIDAHTVAGHKRMIGNVVVREENGDSLVGFENHSGKTYLGVGVQPLGKVLVGHGNNGEDGFEGVRQDTVFGTYLHGSLLPKNPHFADQLLKLALKRRYGNVFLRALDDKLEDDAHEAALSLRA
jgi:lipid II isoglutaminyl synthase (glutamine-hydrolysing)